MAKPVYLTIKLNAEGLEQLRAAAEAFVMAFNNVKITAETVTKEENKNG